MNVTPDCGMSPVPEWVELNKNKQTYKQTTTKKQEKLQETPSKFVRTIKQSKKATFNPAHL